MYITPEQETVMTVLSKTGCLTQDQVFRVLRSKYPHMTASYAQRLVYQLQHINKARQLPDGTITTYLFGKHDGPMLSAVDVMLDICQGVPPAWASRRDPFQLTFLFGEKLKQFAVLWVPEGMENQIGAVAEGSGVEAYCHIIFILPDLNQKKSILTRFPHYFAYRDNGRYRYFKGGDA